MENVNIIAEIGTGLADKTKPRSIPASYKEKSMMDVINYLEKVIVRDGNDDDKSIITDVHDHMKENHVIDVNGKNINPGAAFKKVLEQTTQVEDAGEADEEIKFRNVSITVTRVQEGGIW